MWHHAGFTVIAGWEHCVKSDANKIIDEAFWWNQA